MADPSRSNWADAVDRLEADMIPLTPSEYDFAAKLKRIQDQERRGRVSAIAAGWVLIGLAVMTALVNTSDAITDLQDWHGAVSPSFVGPFIKQLGTAILAAAGGKLLPSGRE